MKAQNIQKELRKFASKERAKTNAWFFKTGLGQYGYGDVFIGVSNPDARKVAVKYKDIDFPDILELLNSKIHEERFVALEILVLKFENAVKDKDYVLQKKIVNFYLKNKDRINNWDLVDTSASYILGAYLFDKDREVLYKLAKSKNLWHRRIGIIATHYFIKQKDFSDTLKISILLMKDKEDLLHKAIGWMLREVGKQDEKSLTKFLDEYKLSLPRTSLRYAIERLSLSQKKNYMKK
jgi:3-methyladenine DNA glycosylase AlkD